MRTEHSCTVCIAGSDYMDNPVSQNLCELIALISESITFL